MGTDGTPAMTEPSTTTALAKATARGHVRESMGRLSDAAATIFDFGETAWREYRSARFYVDLLRAEGFTVEEASGGMPTAFCATWENKPGGGAGSASASLPTIGGYVEYDGVPGNCQAADTVKRPREGLHTEAGGHTDPHSALGISSLGGFLSAKHAMERHGIPGRLVLMGEPAEKVRGSKPIHAAAGYYDDLDLAISFHPFYMPPLCNTVRWDTHCGAAFGAVYSFLCETPETFSGAASDKPIAVAHSDARAPGANDAAVHMYLFARSLQQSIIAGGLNWSMSEAFLTMGQATADNLPARLAELMYMARVSEVGEAEHVFACLDRFAASAAAVAHCDWQRTWVTKGRPGLANHALAAATYANLSAVGAPKWGPDAIRFARDIQREVGIEPMERPFLPMTEELIEPQEAERRLRAMLPASQRHFTSDDYTEYCWHAPTVRLYVGRPTLAPAPDGRPYPGWVSNALGGLRETIAPTIEVAAQTIAMTVIDGVCDADLRARAKAEFIERTGGGIGGSSWLAPLCDYAPPIHFRWPEYVETPRGRREWVIPTAGG